MLPPLLLPLHLIMIIPEVSFEKQQGISGSFWRGPHDDQHSWYHSLQTVGERFEDHMKTIDLLLQKLDSWVEEQLGALEMMVSDHIQNLWERLEEHTKDLNVWLNMYFWVLQEFHDRYLKDSSDYTLSKEILLHGNHLDEHISKADMLLEHPNITLYKWLEEAPLVFYKALEIQGSDEGSSLQEYTEIHIEHLEDHVKILEQVLDNYTATTDSWLEEYATAKEAPSQKYTWNLLSVGPQAQMLVNAQVVALQEKCLSVMKWLEEHVEALEQWLWDTINWQQKKTFLQAFSSAF